MDDEFEDIIDEGLKIVAFVKCDNIDVDAVVTEHMKAKWRLQLTEFFERPVKLLVLSDLLTIADLTESGDEPHGYETR